MDEVTRMDTEQPVRPGTYLRQALGENGWCGRLLTPIQRAAFAEREPAEAFKLFTKRIRVGESFTLTELLLGPELFYGREVVGKPGDGIYLLRDAVRDPRLGNTLLGRSVPGIYGLLTAAGGADLELPGGVTEEQVAFERLFLLRERDGKQLAESGVAPLLQVGTVVPPAGIPPTFRTCCPAMRRRCGSGRRSRDCLRSAVTPFWATIAASASRGSIMSTSRPAKTGLRECFPAGWGCSPR